MHRRIYRAVPGVTSAPCRRSRGFVLAGPSGRLSGGPDGPEAWCRGGGPGAVGVAGLGLLTKCGVVIL
jgi:hypothetical protein